MHGLGTGPGGWAPQEAAFGGERDVLVPPLRLDSGFTVDAEADRLWETLPPGPLDLCGLSLGGIVALRMALDRPERVHRLAVCSSFARLPRRYRLLQTALAAVAGVVPESFLRAQLVDALPEEARATALAEIAGLDRAAVRAVFREGARFDVSAELGRLAMPVLVLVGDRDRVNKSPARELAGALPNAGLEVLPGAGHVANLDAPETFTSALRGFLDEPDPLRPSAS